MKKIFLLMSILLFGFSCGKEEQSDVVEVEFWTISLQSFDGYFNDLIAEYEAANPGVKIVWKDLPYSGLEEKLLSSIAGGDAPDVVNLNTELVLQLSGKNVLEKIDDSLTQEERDAYLSGLYKSMNGYALPWYTNGVPVSFVNENIIGEAGLSLDNFPKTTDELTTWGAEIKEKTGSYGFYMAVDPMLFIEEGIEIMTPDRTKTTINSEVALNYLKKTKELYDNDIVPKVKHNFDNQIIEFNSGNVAILTVGAAFANKIAADLLDDVEVMEAPKGENKIDYSSTMNISVISRGKQTEAGVEFAKFLTNNKNQLEFAKATGTVFPSTKMAYQDEFFTEIGEDTLKDKARKIVVKSMTDSIYDFPHFIGTENAGTIRGEMKVGMENIYFNNGNPKEEMDKVAERINGKLK